MPASIRNGLFPAFFVLGAFFWYGNAPIAGAAGASLYLAPSSGTFTVGSTFTVSLYSNTGGQSVNAIEANLSFPPEKLQVVSPTAGRSLIEIWTAQPTFSNTLGTLKFQGAVPSPGINTESGLISTVTFRVKDVGTSIVRILDSSRVLLNDGRGTNILSQKADGLYTLGLPPPAGPIVVSPTNPDQETWYATQSVVFRWDPGLGSEGYSYVLNELPVDDPDEISEGNRTAVSYRDLRDGVYYFHIKRLRDGIWGGVTHYKVQVDNIPPAAFSPRFSPGDYTSNPRPIIEFSTTDSVSGIDHYEIKLIPLDPPKAVAAEEIESTPFFVEATSPYSINLGVGRYETVVRAYDRAGNYYQATARLSIVQRLFEFIGGKGLRLGGVYVLGWPYVWIIGGFLFVILLYFAKVVWSWHRQVEEKLTRGASAHPDIWKKLSFLKTKRSEYGSSGGKSAAVVVAFLLFSALWFSTAQAQGIGGRTGLAVEPPVVTLFPETLSNDEIFYIGGRAGAPDATVLVYLQDEEQGTTFSHEVKTDKTGSWFYSLPQFLNASKYVVWTQLKIGEELSPPSPRLDLLIAPTAIQFGKDRLSFQDFYFILTLLLGIALVGVVSFIVYHSYHVRKKSRHFMDQVREAEESIKRGFLLLRHDIEAELAFIHKAKLGKQFSEEERIREEKLLRDLEAVSKYVDREIWELEKSQRNAV